MNYIYKQLPLIMQGIRLFRYSTFPDINEEKYIHTYKHSILYKKKWIVLSHTAAPNSHQLTHPHRCQQSNQCSTTDTTLAVLYTFLPEDTHPNQMYVKAIVQQQNPKDVSCDNFRSVKVHFCSLNEYLL